MRGIHVPVPNASAESPTDMAKLPQALMGLNLLSSEGKALRSSDFVGFETAPMRLSRAAFGEKCVVANVNRNPRSSAKDALYFFNIVDRRLSRVLGGLILIGLPRVKVVMSVLWAYSVI